MPAFSISSRSNSNSRRGRWRRTDRKVTSWLSGSRRTSPTRTARFVVSPVTHPVRCPPEDGPDPRHQLSWAQRQRQVVICPRHKCPRNEVLVVGADKEDRETRVLGPQFLAEGKAISFEAPVDYGDVGPTRAHG